MMDEAKDTRKLPSLRPLPKVGQELGHFIIERELPRGGQARVFRAWQVDLGRPVALKLLPSTVVTDAEALTRFRREVENVAKLAHPNIVRIYEAGELEGHPFFTMEYLDGEDAEAKLRRSSFAPDEAASIIEVIARAVHEAHSKDIVHRDIKPGNVFIKRDGTPVLADFGLAQDLSQTGQLTQTGVSMGTPAYMSPEQARGERHRLGKRSDVYGLGATLYSMLTGKRPADGASAYEIMMKVAESQGPRWSRGDADVIPADLRAVVEMAMQNDPAKRYDSAAALADDLERFLAGEWVVARGRSWLQKAFFRVKRYAAVAAVILIAIALGAGIVWTSLDPPGRSSNTGNLLPERDIWRPVTAADPEDIKRFVGPGQDWVAEGAALGFGPNRELVLTRNGTQPIVLAHRDDLCWGDFELEAMLSVREAGGEVALLIGLPPEPAQDSPPQPREPAYRIVLGAQAPQRFEIRRLGVPVLGGQSIAAPRLLVPGAWYRARFVRNGENLRFELRADSTDVLVAAASFEDDFPALVEGRRRFALSADAAALAVRDVAIRHRDSARAAEALLFAVGAYGETELRLAARLSAPRAEGEDANERAGWHLLRARCLQALGRTQDALNEYAQVNLIASDPRLRARAFLQSALLKAAQGEDQAALVQFFAARNNSDNNPELSSRVFHAALTHARLLTESDKPARASAYYDFVSGSVRTPDPYLTCAALVEGSRLRMKLADVPGAPEDDVLGQRKSALISLRRLREGPYQSYSAVYADALDALFDLRLPEASLGRATLDADTTAAVELIDAGTRLAAIQGIDRKAFVPALMRASWLARLSLDSVTVQGALRNSETLLAATEAAGDDEARLWVRTLRALTAEERRLGTGRARFEAWQKLLADIRALSADKPDPRHDALVMIATLFTREGTEQEFRGHLDAFRRGMARALPEHDTLWRGEASPAAFIDYVAAVAVSEYNPAAVEPLLEALTNRPDAGLFRLLKGRLKNWLPATIG